VVVRTESLLYGEENLEKIFFENTKNSNTPAVLHFLFFLFSGSQESYEPRAIDKSALCISTSLLKSHIQLAHLLLVIAQALL